MHFYSHLKKSKTGKIIEGSKIELKEHLKSVAACIEKEINLIQFQSKIENKIISKIGYLIGLSHDFAKYTTFFQNKLINDTISNYSKHGLLSALFVFYIVKNYIEIQKIEEQPYYKFLPLIAYQIVKHHHGNLQNITTDVELQNDIEILNVQIKNLQNNVGYIQKELAPLFQEILTLNLQDFFVQFTLNDEYLSQNKIQIEYNLRKYLYFFAKNDKDSLDYYFLINQYLYSLLVSNDKKVAANVEQIPRVEFEGDIVDLYKRDRFKINDIKIQECISKNIDDLQLQQLREKIYQEIAGELYNVLNQKNETKRIFTITAPTGMGKTLASLNAALILRENCKKKFQFTPRIIYSLPFTSIIEQNYSEIENIFEKMLNIKNDSRYFLKHHYFSNVEYKINDESKPVDDSLLYIENWESEIIVTTFIQVFYTLVGYENRMLKKFHKFANSIIILDEVQNIPVKYWPLVNKILELITKYFNSYIILLTATKPLIFSENESYELVRSHGDYFKSKQLNRTKLVKTEIKDYDTLVSHIRQVVTDNSKNSILIILNTIRSSKEVFQKIKNMNELSSFDKFYLSTNITPFERKNRIDSIKTNVKNKKRTIIVSTQLIEAGVDIDVNVIYRDMAPVDSLIQSAGRANRSGLSTISDVYLISLEDRENKNKKFSSYVYDDIILKQITQKIFDENFKNNEIEEKSFLNKIVNRYFEELNDFKSKHASNLLIESMRDFYYFDKDAGSNRIPISDFSLIPEKYDSISLFVAIDNDAVEVWQKFDEIHASVKPNFEKKKEFASIKGDFYSYLINIPSKEITAKNIAEITKDLFFLNVFESTDLYDKTMNSGLGYLTKNDLII